MTDLLEVGDTYHVMPGSTFRKTWEVIEIEGGRATVRCVDRAVGYQTGATDEFDHEKLSKSVESGVLTGEIVKILPDMETKLVP